MSLDRSELRSWLLLMSGIQSLFDALDRQLRDDEGMSHDDYRILSSLYRAPGRVKRMKDLAHDMSYSPSRLTHAAARLEKQGWVVRSRSDDDGRGVVIELTQTGVAKARKASKGHLMLVKQLVFDTSERVRLETAIETLDQIGKAAASRR